MTHRTDAATPQSHEKRPEDIVAPLYKLLLPNFITHSRDRRHTTNGFTIEINVYIMYVRMDLSIHVCASVITNDFTLEMCMYLGVYMSE